MPGLSSPLTHASCKRRRSFICLGEGTGLGIFLDGSWLPVCIHSTLLSALEALQGQATRGEGGGDPALPVTRWGSLSNSGIQEVIFWVTICCILSLSLSCFRTWVEERVLFGPLKPPATFLAKL